MGAISRVWLVWKCCDRLHACCLLLYTPRGEGCDTLAHTHTRAAPPPHTHRLRLHHPCGRSRPDTEAYALRTTPFSSGALYDRRAVTPDLAQQRDARQRRFMEAAGMTEGSQWRRCPFCPVITGRSGSSFNCPPQQDWIDVSEGEVVDLVGLSGLYMPT